MSGEDPIDAAERQMAERVAAQQRELSDKLKARLGPDFDPTTDEGRQQMKTAWEALVAEDPDARELAEGFAAYLRIHRARAEP